MCMTPAKDIGESLLNIGVRCFRIPVEIGLGRHDDAIHAKPALHRLFIDKGFLNRMRLVAGSEPLKRRNVASGNAGNRSYTRSDGLTFNDHSTRTALPQAASEF